MNHMPPYPTNHIRMFLITIDGLISLSKRVNIIKLIPNATIGYVYEQVGEYTDEMKEYFYNKMLEYYPDKSDYYAYILEE